jgi:transposase
MGPADKAVSPYSSEGSMNSSSSYFVGIDVSKPYLDVHRLPDQAAQRFDNTATGHRRLIAWLAQQPVGMVVLEASGGYERAAVVAMVDAHLPVIVAQPRVIRAFAESFGQRAKTDEIDAAMLARYARDRHADLKPIEQIDPARQALADQVTRRDQLLRMHTMEQNRLQQTSDKTARRSVQRSLNFLAREIAVLEKAIDRAIQAAPALAEKARTLQETRGVGPQTARVLIAALPELGEADPKRLNALVGVAPYPRDSGDTQAPRHITGGRALVRNALYMAALSASRCNPVIKPYYLAMRARGLAHKTALIACIRRLLAHFNQQIRLLGHPALSEITT